MPLLINGVSRYPFTACFECLVFFINLHHQSPDGISVGIVGHICHDVTAIRGFSVCACALGN